ncbi:MAG TPA: hypothetical protein VHB97_23915, partial [Polyangia bacterium]|nr:hypothetical protein [Polyangia bacterium]
MKIDFTSKTLVHTVDGAEEIVVERAHVYATDHGPLGFDVYRPRHATVPSPAVVFASGLPDPGVTAMLGKPLKDFASYV